MVGGRSKGSNEDVVRLFGMVLKTRDMWGTVVDVLIPFVEAR